MKNDYNDETYFTCVCTISLNFGIFFLEFQYGKLFLKLIWQLLVTLAFIKCKNNLFLLYLTLFWYTSFVQSTKISKIPPCLLGFRLSLFQALSQDDRKAVRDG